MVYMGNVVDSILGSGTLIVSLVNVAGLMSGTWEESLGGKGDKLYITSTVSSSIYTATFEACPSTENTSCNPDCVLAFVGALTSSNLSGAYRDVPNRFCLVRTGSITLAT
jgi:hypothetical protein